MRNKIISHAAVSFAIVSLLVGCGGLSSEQKTAAGDALKSLKKISAATEVGVSYQQYGTMVVEAKAQVNEAATKLPDGDLKKELNAAMDAYADALTAWGSTLKTGSLHPKLEPGETLTRKYSLVDEGINVVSRKQALSAIWSKGNEHLDRASKLLEH